MVPLHDLIINSNQKSKKNKKSSYHLLNACCLKDTVLGNFLVLSHLIRNVK